MTIADRLQAIAKERGTTFKQLEREIGIGNGTLRRWEEQSPRLDKLMKVANYLHVSLDYLVYGKDIAEPGDDSEAATGAKVGQEPQELAHDSKPLADEEADLVAMYRFLPCYVREDLFDQIHCLYRKYAERKKESIYWTYKEGKDAKSEPGANDEGQSGIA